MSGAGKRIFTIRNDQRGMDWRSLDFVKYARMSAEWTDEGVPRRVQGPNGKWFTYVSTPKGAESATAYESLIPVAL